MKSKWGYGIDVLRIDNAGCGYARYRDVRDERERMRKAWKSTGLGNATGRGETRATRGSY